MKKEILGVKIDDITTTEAVETVKKWLLSNDSPRLSKPKIIVTPGPEFIVVAQKDLKFKDLLNRANLSIPDGFGLNLFGGIRNRVPGVEFMGDLCKLASREGWTIGLFGGWGDEAALTKSYLEKTTPGVKISWAVGGEEADSIIAKQWGRAQLPQVDLLFVALGMGKQESFIYSATNYKVAMGVGSAFDYLSQKSPRAPSFLRTLGLEWLHRLIFRTKNFRRIWAAVITFPILIIKSKLHTNLKFQIRKWLTSYLPK